LLCHNGNRYDRDKHRDGSADIPRTLCDMQLLFPSDGFSNNDSFRRVSSMNDFALSHHAHLMNVSVCEKI
jgi:hypothetical protein